MQNERLSRLSNAESLASKINFLLKNDPQDQNDINTKNKNFVLDSEKEKKNNNINVGYRSTSNPRILDPKNSKSSSANKEDRSFENEKEKLNESHHQENEVREMKEKSLKDPSVYSRTSNISRNSSISQLNFGTNLSTYSKNPPKQKKDEKGKYVKEEHIVKTSYMKHFGQSLSEFSSKRGDHYSRHSNDSGMNNFTFPINGNKNMNMLQLIQVKREEAQVTGVRKRVCRKIYSILYKDCKVGNSTARDLTLGVEARINHFYPHHVDSKLYIKTVKTLFRKIKVIFNLILDESN